jgi:hypothetical protein
MGSTAQQQHTTVNQTQGTPAVLVSREPAKLHAKQHSSSNIHIGEALNLLLLLLHLEHCGNIPA